MDYAHGVIVGRLETDPNVAPSGIACTALTKRLAGKRAKAELLVKGK